MKVITAENPYFYFVPRFYPPPTAFLALDFDSGIIVPFIWALEKDKIKITLSDVSMFKQRDNYSFTVLYAGDILFKGKIIFLKNGTDIQNYTNQSQDNKPWK